MLTGKSILITGGTGSFGPKTILTGARLSDVDDVLNKNLINNLIVVNQDMNLVGIISYK